MKKKFTDAELVLGIAIWILVCMMIAANAKETFMKKVEVQKEIVNIIPDDMEDKCYVKEEDISKFDFNDLSVTGKILSVAGQENFQSTDILLKLARCESRFDKKAVGDGGKAHGLYQIHYKIHGITKNQANNIEFATKWTIEKLRKGKCHLWTCCPKNLKHERFE
jgi:hypothetical protein